MEEGERDARRAEREARREWRRGPPPWWPEAEPWPPRHGTWGRRSMWHGGRPRFWFLFPLFFFGLLFAFVAFIAAIGALFGPWYIALAIGALGTLVAVGTRGFAMPVGAILDAVERVGEGDYGVRVRVRGPRQVRVLAGSFNAMVERLAQNEAQRRRLLADVSHELRTPLTVMQGQLEGLLDGVYPRDDTHLEPILEETRVMARIIDDLRTLSLAEAGALELHREPTDVRTLLEDVVATFRTQADTAGVALVADAPAPLPAMEVDAVRLHQVLANLVANALRYTPSGGRVTVRASAEAGGLRIEVSDNGAGIAPEALPHVFERFYRSADSRGSGLGLPIARSLVAAHGGELVASSDGPGRGTTMRLTLPASASRAS